MVHDTAQDAFTAQSWHTLCRELQSSTRERLKLHSASVQEMVLGIVARFCQQVPPTAEEGLTRRFRQRKAISSMIQSVLKADDWARSNPAVAGEVYDLARRRCEQDLPMTDDELGPFATEMLRFDAQIRNICQ